MKILNPQAALLTNAEVHYFLTTNPPRQPDKRIGSYKSVDLTGYNAVRRDFDLYIQRTTPHIATYPAPEDYIPQVVHKLKHFGLTKTEALMVMNLGIGNDLHQLATDTDADGKTVQPTSEEQEAEAGEEVQEQDQRQRLALVVEELDDRFPGEEGEAKIQGILDVMRQCFQSNMNGAPKHNGMNGSGAAEQEAE